MSRRHGLAGLGFALALTFVGTPAPAAAQDPSSDEEAVMVAAARWAVGRLPSGSLRLDPHRTGEGGGQALASRIARAVGAELGTLEQTRVCSNPMDASTCRLESDALVAIATPRISRDQASVRVYAWHRTSSASEPVARQSWDLRLTRTAGGWVVAG